MIKNRRTTDGYTYTVPSPETYPYQWLWDSCFHAMILCKFDTETAKDELRSLVVKQFEDGMIPHMIYWERGKLHDYQWGKEGTSAITQPPILADAIWKIYQTDKDLNFLKELYPKARDFYKYLIKERDPRSHHLIGIINPDESGEDNSPRFDEVLEVEADITQDDHLKKRLGLVSANRECDFNVGVCMKKHFWVKDVPFNSLCIKNLNTLSEIALLLGYTEDAESFKLNSDLIARAMREFMWQDGTFWPIDIDHNKIKVSTWAHFAPMIANLYSPEEARLIVEKYFTAEELLGEFGIRTVSKKEKSYDPTGFWRGPIWMVPHWVIYKGLINYGFTKEADLIKEKSLQLIEKSGFREYFNPETGEGYGAEDFTWGGLVLDMD